MLIKVEAGFTDLLKRLSTVYVARRNFIPGFGSKGSGRRLHYSDKRVLGYSMEQMFDVVASVENYKTFLPWCTQSTVYDRKPGQFRCDLSVGYPPLAEKYSCLVTVSRPHLVKSESTDGYLFNYLLTTWKFSPGVVDNPSTCTVDFSVAFEFRSALHTKVATAFFDDIVKTMVNAFLKQARRRYGPAHPVIAKTVPK